jgi:hypothetical protein
VKSRNFPGAQADQVYKEVKVEIEGFRGARAGTRIRTRKRLRE